MDSTQPSSTITPAPDQAAPAAAASDVAPPATGTGMTISQGPSTDELAEETLLEEVSIDGMCGVY